MLDVERRLLRKGKGATTPRLSSHPIAMTVREQWPWRFANSWLGEFPTMSCTLLEVESVLLGCGRCSLLWKKSDGSTRDPVSSRSSLTVSRQWSKPTTPREMMSTNGRIPKQSLSVYEYLSAWMQNGF